MNFLKTFDWSWRSILKVVGVIVIGILLLALALSVLAGVIRTVLGGMDGGYSGSSMGYEGSDHPVAVGGMVREIAATMQSAGKRIVHDDYDYDIAEESYYEPGIPPIPGSGASADAEEYEVERNSISYRTSRATDVCKRVEELKDFEYVVFDSSNFSEEEGACHMTFRVENEKADEIKDTLRALNPYSWNENSYTIEPSVTGNTFELELQRERLALIEKSILDTEAAYDELVRLARGKGDVDSLTQIINNRINTQERLGNQKRNTLERIARLEESGGSQIDQTEYVHFNVSVSERKIVDLRSIKESWMSALENLAWDVNKTLQGLVIGLLSFVLMIFKVLVYLFVLLAIAKVAWTIGKRIWRWEVMKNKDSLHSRDMNQEM